MRRPFIWLALFTILVSGVAIGMAGTVIFVRSQIQSAAQKAYEDPSEATLRVITERLQMTPEQQTAARATWNAWRAKMQLARLQAVAISNIPAYAFLSDLGSSLTPQQLAELDRLVDQRIQSVNPKILARMFDVVGVSWRQKERIDQILAARSKTLDGESFASGDEAAMRLLISSQSELLESLDESQRPRLVTYIKEISAQPPR